MFSFFYALCAIHMYRMHETHMYTMRHMCISYPFRAFLLVCRWLSSGYMRGYKVDTRISTL